MTVGGLNYEEVLFVTKDFQKKVNTLSLWMKDGPLVISYVLVGQACS